MARIFRALNQPRLIALGLNFVELLFIGIFGVLGLIIFNLGIGVASCFIGYGAGYLIGRSYYKGNLQRYCYAELPFFKTSKYIPYSHLTNFMGKEK